MGYFLSKFLEYANALACFEVTWEGPPTGTHFHSVPLLPRGQLVEAQGRRNGMGHSGSALPDNRGFPRVHGHHAALHSSRPVRFLPSCFPLTRVCRLEAAMLPNVE